MKTMAGARWMMVALVGWGGSVGAMTYETPISGQSLTDFFISHLVDHGAGAEVFDYTGGFQTYDGHRGTDISLIDFKKMEEGIDVLAAAPGTVVEVQDGFFDRNTRFYLYYPGNYLTILHSDGSYGMYYHFKRNSVTVTTGQVVTEGQKLGEVGSSGWSFLPHVHFQVTLDGEPCEPFTNDHNQEQSFDWFDSYSNQVRRVILSMGVSVTNDPAIIQANTYMDGANFFRHTPRVYSVMNWQRVFVLWVKVVGAGAGETCRVRLEPVFGSGYRIDMSDYPLVGNNYVLTDYWLHWNSTDLTSGTTYKLQYQWNDGDWQDGPGANTVTIQESGEEVYTERVPEMDNHYVNPSSASPTSPYTSWDTAASDIQTAIDAAEDGDTILVTNGIYATGSRTVDGTPTRVVVDKSVYVKSVNGPLRTTIRGQGPAGTDAVRCAYVGNGAILAGFTLCQGAVRTDAGSQRGGGAMCESDRAVICNSIIISNAAMDGGGSDNGNLVNCLLVANTASRYGGGLYSGKASFSTVADNTAGTAGGGVYASQLDGSIVYYNTAGSTANNADFSAGGWACNTCLEPAPEGATGCITNEPRFADRTNGNYRLASDSPCLDRYTFLAGGGLAQDLAFRLRVINDLADMGAYEYFTPLDTPESLAAGDGTSRAGVVLTWSSVSDASGYAVWRHTADDNNAALEIGSSSSNAYLDACGDPGVIYYYWVKATNAISESEFSLSDEGWKRRPMAVSYTTNAVSDLAVFDQNTGNWYILTVSGNLVLWAESWGWPGAEPVSGDYDGDGISDLAVFDQNTGNWYILTVSGTLILWAESWGWPGADPVSGDYDGDGISDLAVFDQNTGNWYILTVSGNLVLWAESWGWPGADPVSGDYDGDGISDLAVFDQNTGNWYIRTVAGSLILWAQSWGWSGARLVSGDYDGDGISDLAVFDQNTGYWYICTVDGNVIVWAQAWGWPGAEPVSGDYDGDGISDMTVFDQNTGNWYSRTVSGTLILWALSWGWPGAEVVSGGAW